MEKQTRHRNLEMCAALENKLLPLLAVSHELSCCPSECIISGPLYILRDSRSCNNKHSRAEPILMAFREMATALLHQRLVGVYRSSNRTVLYSVTDRMERVKKTRPISHKIFLSGSITEREIPECCSCVFLKSLGTKLDRTPYRHTPSTDRFVCVCWWGEKE